MGVTPQYQGKYGKPWTITLNTDSGAENLTGILASAISIVVRNFATNPPTDSVSTGAITIVTANPAVITWQPTTSDYANVGSFVAIPEVTFATGPVAYDPISFEVRAV